jgi:hypothetical protein
MPPNLVQLSECPMGVMSPVYVTDAERYQGVYSTVDKLRRSLVHNKHFRKPYLDLLKTLYTKKGRMSENIKHIPIKPPTDANIQDYFHDEWPEIRFVPDACDDINGEGFLWGYTNVGRASADENMIHVKLGLIRHWREMVSVARCPNGIGVATDT